MQAAANVFNAPNIFINFNNFYNCIRLFLKIDTLLKDEGREKRATLLASSN